jgi:hypothetical protein
MLDSPQVAAEQAENWCNKHPNWQRICDVRDLDALNYTWKELPKRDKAFWIKAYGKHAQNAWDSLCTRSLKVPFGYITSNREFFKDITLIPENKNFMMILKVE